MGMFAAVRRGLLFAEVLRRREKKLRKVLKPQGE